MLHGKRTFRDWKQGGVVPPFLQDRGGGGLFAKKENRGEGGARNFGGHPPCPELLGWGGGSWGGIFFELPGRDLRFLENPQQLNHGFSEILGNAIAVFGKTVDPDTGIFREKPQIPSMLRRRAAMIICGAGCSWAGRHRSFLRIAGSCIALFKKSGATRLRFLENPPQLNHGFRKIRSRSREHF